MPARLAAAGWNCWPMRRLDALLAPAVKFDDLPARLPDILDAKERHTYASSLTYRAMNPEKWGTGFSD